jgi:hypothetical protein
MIFSTYCDLELRQRFTEDMDIRKLKAEIQINYLRANPGHCKVHG